jgi:predicted signal transduction protein with EAL and GGDEF domain/FixJ family two-component response regulator
MSARPVVHGPGVLDRPRVLLVDDDEVNLLLTSIALRERGFDVTEANCGRQALDSIAEDMPDLVLLDALMPDMNGFDTCRRLRELPGAATLPVLMLTGLDDDASISRAVEAGATDFFVKSAQWTLLAGRLGYLLRSSRTRIELERSKSRLARAQDLARMGSVDWRRGQGEPEFSTEGLRVLGKGPKEALGFRAFLRMVPKEDRGVLIGVLKQALQDKALLDTDVMVCLPDGRQRVIHLEAEPELTEPGKLLGYSGIVQDVTDRRMAEDKIRHLANFDTLTGLPNRRQLIWRGERALDHARRLNHRVAFLLIDLDRFKIVNDTLGHAAGDELLLEVARRLRLCVRHSDQVVEAALESPGSRSHPTLEAVGRLGGDEFIALLPEVADEAEAEQVGERIVQAMRPPVFVEGQECFVTASVGISMYPRDGLQVVDLLRNADVAMYAVKAQGRNAAASYRPALAGKGREKLELESALHKAIERNELVLHYQPKLDMRSMRMVGVEALMRWQRGSSLVPPGDFIPLAEETGLIVEMSAWAIREAARQSRAWKDQFGFVDAIAVNLPNRMFERSDLVSQIDSAVTEHGLQHEAIMLEITETGLMKDLQHVIPTLHRLKEIGVQISIDDFGTGYSSLAYLTSLPISEVKIDRSFVRDLGLTQQSSAIVTAIVALARSLGLRVVAEGVENVRQMAVLRRLGCDLMQGFLFGRPQLPGDLEAWAHQTAYPKSAPWILANNELGLLHPAEEPAPSDKKQCAA